MSRLLGSYIVWLAAGGLLSLAACIGPSHHAVAPVAVLTQAIRALPLDSICGAKRCRVAKLDTAVRVSTLVGAANESLPIAQWLSRSTVVSLGSAPRSFVPSGSPNHHAPSDTVGLLVAVRRPEAGSSVLAVSVLVRPPAPSLDYIGIVDVRRGESGWTVERVRVLEE